MAKCGRSLHAVVAANKAMPVDVVVFGETRRDLEAGVIVFEGCHRARPCVLERTDGLSGRAETDVHTLFGDALHEHGAGSATASRVMSKGLGTWTLCLELGSERFDLGE